MKYKVFIMPEAASDLQRLAKNEPKAFAKANRFIEELAEHPKTGTGHPEPLKGKLKDDGAVKSLRNTDSCIVFSKPRCTLMY